MSENILNISVVCGSVRTNRKSIYPARLIADKINQAGHEGILVDFVSMPLPFVDSDPNPSSLNKVYPHENVQKWSAIADKADGFVLVSPEYNHGYPGVLKNALDWLYPEFGNKPVALVGVSDGNSGGLRAIEQLRPLMANFNMYDIQTAVGVKTVQDAFDAAGNLLDQSLHKSLDKLLTRLFDTAKVMRGLR